MRYRCCLLAIDNRIAASASFEASDDAQAVELARLEFASSASFPMIELWHGIHLVQRTSISNRAPSVDTTT